MDIKNSVIAITGAGQGLGQMMAITLAQSGADLALLDVNETGLRETQSQCQMLSAKVFTYPVDVTNESDVEATFDTILQDFGQLNGLINNAGVLRDGLLVKAKDGVISKMSLEQFNLVMNVNVTGTFLCGREAAVKMIESGSQGVIINISSVARAGNIGQTNYSASKAAVATMATTWARELARYGIRAAAIAPGVVHTAMADQMKPEAIERLEKMIPVGRIGEASEIAHAVKYILESDYFTGRVLEVDGGIRM
ncbi:SDR family oxidoreductase [Vibrio parahaemolyticus]|uniref:SDR family oxidoreductase n=1 Tax=Vibrio parahaemolyticus TaxID=670 RepID=UPI0007A00435|nr:SDR family oxidoreductase [Vibrio parahaemolyticus]EHZ7349915.1 SDR family oxidoreductase [Vibrio parahaemolyticus]EJG0380565.1 SDR family oxidoreductase [Vibrio parahaemolyticus]EJG0400125.1 SDR family oxidoreductase [Vibrio parahaemolyticus]ELN8944956.1 SDR family oxidoreductase [Vibrio parahaemolyticus]KYY21583.1 3-ketoacyl-ACP reductase [Vibrio parahaemolyticus]